jgi:hypothetical protein
VFPNLLRHIYSNLSKHDENEEKKTSKERKRKIRGGEVDGWEDSPTDPSDSEENESLLKTRKESKGVFGRGPVLEAISLILVFLDSLGLSYRAGASNVRSPILAMTWVNGNKKIYENDISGIKNGFPAPK